MADRIAKLRADRGLSQEKLANEAGVHRGYLIGIEGATRNPTLDVLAAIAAVLKVRVVDLLAEDA